MTTMGKLGRRLLLAVGAVIALAPAAWGQSCALCYMSAAASKQAAAALRQGILVLLFPPIAICLGFVTLGYRSRERSDQDADPGEWE